MRLLQLEESAKIGGGSETFPVGETFLGLSLYEQEVIRDAAIAETNQQRDEANAGLAEAQAQWDLAAQQIWDLNPWLALAATLADPGRPILVLAERTPPTSPGPEPSPPQEPWWFAYGTGSGSGSNEDMFNQLMDYLYAYQDYEYAHDDWAVAMSQYEIDLEAYNEAIESDEDSIEWFNDNVYNPWFEDTFWRNLGILDAGISQTLGERPTSSFNYNAAYDENYQNEYNYYVNNYLKQNMPTATFDISELPDALFWDPDLNDGFGGYAANVDALASSAIAQATAIYGSGWVDISITYPEDFPLEHAG